MINLLRFRRLFYALLTISLLALTTAAQTNPPIRLDPVLTPGDVLEVTARDICVVGYTKRVRNVPESVKKKVYAEYGIRSHLLAEFEVDHLISLELGGSNAITNLWPESYHYTSIYNAHIKDVLENKMHRMVCAGQMDLRAAQQEIAIDWISVYHRYVLQDVGGTLATNQRQTSTRITKTTPINQPAARQLDYGNAGASISSTYSRQGGKTGARRSDDSAQQAPLLYYRVPVQSQRKKSKRCKWKNIWCGFGLLR